MNEGNIRACCALPSVRRRITEYLGAHDDGRMSCVYVADPDSGWPRLGDVHRPEALEDLLDAGRDVSRSLWDRDSLIAHLDIEYVNFEFPDEPYLHPRRTFALQEPVCRAVEGLLAGHGITPLHMISGRGHHYVWRVCRDGPAFAGLRALGHCNETLLGRYRHPGLPLGGAVPADLGLAFAGLGLLMEFLAGRIKAEAADECLVPVELTAVAVGPGERGREMISIDISEYGDPLHIRVIRAPFTPYLKRSSGTSTAVLDRCSPLLTTLLPAGMSTVEAVRARREPDMAAQLARQTDACIPECSDGTLSLICSYGSSALHEVHDQFYGASHHPPETWSRTYDRLALDLLPPCIARVIAAPNDRLMKPAAIEMVVRALLALGWHPRHIAGLIRSRYERDYGWGDQWLIHDAATRADFYTRIFTGLFATGLDDLVDFNCCSIREKGLCISPAPPCDVERLRVSLLERRRHGRLAHRPFNRLFLS